MKKKFIVLFLTLSLISIFTGCGSSSAATDSIQETESIVEETESIMEEEETTVPETDSEEPVSISVQPEYEEGSIEKEIQDYVVNYIEENYTFTDIEEIAINENAGTEEAGDYIILARLTWNQKNSAGTTQTVLAMYSEDFAARVGSDQPSVTEMAVFWTIPYLEDANAKWAYERGDGGMYLSDNMMDAIFNQ